MCAIGGNFKLGTAAEDNVLDRYLLIYPLDRSQTPLNPVNFLLLVYLLKEYGEGTKKGGMRGHFLGAGHSIYKYG